MRDTEEKLNTDLKNRLIPSLPISQEQQYLNDWEHFCAFASKHIQSLQSVERHHRIFLDKAHKKLKLKAIEERMDTKGRWVDAYARVAIKEEKYILARLAVERGVIFNYLLPDGEDFEIYTALTANDENKWEEPDIEGRLASELKGQYHFSDKKAAFFAWLMKKKGLTQELCEYIEYDYQDSKQGLDRINEFIVHGASLNSLIPIAIQLDDINEFDSGYVSPLHIAVGHGYEHLVNWLLQNGADTEVRSGRGYSPLILACMLKPVHRAVIKLLLDYKAKVTAIRYYDNYSPLLLISEGDRPDKDTAEYLLREEYIVNQRSIYGDSALHLISIRDDKEFVELLLKYSSNKYLLDSLNKTPLLQLCTVDRAMDRKPLILLLLQGCELLDEWNDGLINNTVNTLITLCKVKQQVAGSLTNLYELALEKKDFALLRLLIEQGAAILADDGGTDKRLIPGAEEEKVGDKNYSLAQFSQWLRKKIEIFDDMQVAIQKGNKKDVENLLTLHLPPCLLLHGFLHAIKYKDINIINLFLARPQRFDIMGKDYSGNTALHVAVSEESVSVVRILLPYIYSNDTKNKDGKTPLHIAMEKKQMDIIKIFVESGTIDVNYRLGMVRYLFTTAINYEYVEAVEYFLYKGAYLPDLSKLEHQLTSSRPGKAIYKLLKAERDRRNGKEPVKNSGSRKWARSRSNSSSDSKHADSKRKRPARGTERPGDDDMSDED